MKNLRVATVTEALLITLGFLDNSVAESGPVNDPAAAFQTAYPIKHLVVIFQENVSFDHYFATYPNASTLPGRPVFTPKPDTPSVNGLNEVLLYYNLNSLPPLLLGPSQAVSLSHDHGYSAEQKACDSGLMDKFVESTGGKEPATVMDFFDGNTVTALWNYAQKYAMSDNSFCTTFGQSLAGALNLVSGQTHGLLSGGKGNGRKGNLARFVVLNPDGSFTVIGCPDPLGDIASKGKAAVRMVGVNIGDMLNANQPAISWGWFQGGFANPLTQGHFGANGAFKLDYDLWHAPFQYFASTANLKHVPPTSVTMIGLQGDQANHQYDITEFWKAASAHNMPAVSFLKAPAYEDGHPKDSSPLLEQSFLVDTINALMNTPEWNSMAIIINWDDSDGWYDHVMPPIVNQSQSPADFLSGPMTSGTQSPLGGYQGRAGYGPRLPFIVISPFAKSNFVDHTITDQSSILRFIEDNWLGGKRMPDSTTFDHIAGSILNMFDFNSESPNGILVLDPTTGQPASAIPLSSTLCHLSIPRSDSDLGSQVVEPEEDEERD